MMKSFDMYFVCFFKHKTAYEMRISDWSSDVCSSDLHCGVPKTHTVIGRSAHPRGIFLQHAQARYRLARIKQSRARTGDAVHILTRHGDRKSTRLNSSH